MRLPAAHWTVPESPDQITCYGRSCRSRLDLHNNRRRKRSSNQTFRGRGEAEGSPEPPPREKVLRSRHRRAVNPDFVSYASDVRPAVHAGWPALRVICPYAIPHEISTTWCMQKPGMGAVVHGSGVSMPACMLHDLGVAQVLRALRYVAPGSTHDTQDSCGSSPIVSRGLDLGCRSSCRWTCPTLTSATCARLACQLSCDQEEPSMEAECAPSARESPAAESPAAVLATQAGSLELSAASPSARSPAVPSFTMRKQDLNAAPAAFRVRGLTQPRAWVFSAVRTYCLVQAYIWSTLAMHVAFSGLLPAQILTCVVCPMLVKAVWVPAIIPASIGRVLGRRVRFTCARLQQCYKAVLTSGLPSAEAPSRA